jgi:hypothetical protein
MFTTKLRRATDKQFVQVQLAGLAMLIRGQLQLVSASSGPEGSGVKNQGGPAVIVNCVSLQDAQECMAFAARNGVLISVFNGKSEDGTLPAYDGCMAVDLSAVKF